jgi:hypothetical protein
LPGGKIPLTRRRTSFGATLSHKGRGKEKTDVPP